eukprot:3675227-Amphidinium_carterae.1
MVAPYSMHGRLASLHESCRSALANSLKVPSAPSKSACSAPSGSSGSRDIVPPAVTPTHTPRHGTEAFHK